MLARKDPPPPAHSRKEGGIDERGVERKYFTLVKKKICVSLLSPPHRDREKC